MAGLVSTRFLNECKYIYIIRQTIVAVCAFTLGCSVGIGFGFTSFLFKQLKDNGEEYFTDDQQSWIASTVNLAMFPSSLIGGWAVQKCGRRIMVIFSDIFTLVGWITIYCAHDFHVFIWARVFQGVSAGMGYSTFLTYLGEVTYPSIRSGLLMAGPVGVCVGVFVCQLLGDFLPWRTIALIGLIGPIWNIGTEMFLAESFVWHLNRNEVEKSRKCFLWFKGENHIEEFNKTVEDSKREERLSIIELLQLCCTRSFLIPFGITTLVFVTNELTGTQAIVFYTSSILQIISKDSNFEFLSNLVLNIIRILTSILSFMLVKRTSVRLVLISSSVALGFSLLSLSLFLYLADIYSENRILPILSLIALVLIISFFSIGLGPLPTAVCGEMYPLETRALGGSLSASISFAFLFGVVKCIPLLFDSLGPSGTFFFFGICTLCGIFFVHLLLPNTKNKTINEISHMYS